MSLPKQFLERMESILENDFSIYDDFNNSTYDVAFLEYLK